jgi:hypothetical protein
MAVGSGHKCKFALGSNVIGSITKWGLNGVANKMVDASVFLDEWDKFVYGRGNGGKVSISGYLDMADTNGQVALMTAWKNKTTLSTTTTNDPRLFYDATHYFKLATMSPVAECLVEELTFGESDANTGLVAFAATFQVSGGYFEKDS